MERCENDDIINTIQKTDAATQYINTTIFYESDYGFGSNGFVYQSKTRKDKQQGMCLTSGIALIEKN